MGTSLNGLTPAGTYPGLIKTGDNAPIDGTLKTLSDGNGNNLPMSVSTTTINLTGTAQVGGVAIANTTQVAAKQDTLVSGTNIKTINSTSILGSGNINVVTSPSGVSGAIQFSNGSAFASDASNLFWDDTNNRLGVGTNAPITALHVVGQTTFSDNALFSTDFKSIGRDLNNSSIRFASVSSEIRANISTGGQFHVYNAGSGTSRFGVSSGGQTTISGGGSTSATTSLLVQNSAGTSALTIKDDLTSVFSGQTTINGDIICVGNIIRPSRGRINFYGGDGEITLTNSTETSFNVLRLGGLTSSFPALKRSSTTIQARLADDSGYAPIDASLYKVGGTNGFTGTGSYTNFTIVGGIITNAS